METKFQRQPENDKIEVVEALRVISNHYQQTVKFIQMVVYDSRNNLGPLLENLHEYTSCIITVYKKIKPKMSIAVSKKKELKELCFIDVYLSNVEDIAENMDFEDVLNLWKIFNTLEDHLREACEVLGYTNDESSND